MPLPLFVAPLVGWIFRAFIVKFMLLAGLVALFAWGVPMIVGYLAPFLGVSSLTSLFNALPDAWFYFFYLVRFDLGLPLLIAAATARFMIRRIPGLG